MAKTKIIPTREEKIQTIRENLHEVETATRIKAWVFQVEKQYYAIISWFKPLEGQRLDIFPSTRKGVKTSEKSIHTVKKSSDPYEAFDTVIDMLIPNPVSEPL